MSRGPRKDAWNEAQDQILRDHYLTLSDHDLVPLLALEGFPRTATAVCDRRSILGLLRGKGVFDNRAALSAKHGWPSVSTCPVQQDHDFQAAMRRAGMALRP